MAAGLVPQCIFGMLLARKNPVWGCAILDQSVLISLEFSNSRFPPHLIMFFLMTHDATCSYGSLRETLQKCWG